MRKRWMCLAVVMVLVVGAAGCDQRGPHERQLDADLAKETDPTKRQMGDALGRPVARAADEQWRNSTPEQRKAMEQFEQGLQAPSHEEIQKALASTSASDLPQPPAAPPATQTAQAPTTNGLKIGFYWEPLNSTNAATVGLQSGSGIYVRAVQPQSPAASAGIAAGDIICSADGHLLTTTYTLDSAKAMHVAGDSIVLRTWRGGRWVDISVSLVAGGR